MKIRELRAENVKRLKAIDITPDGTLQVIGGRNAQGKSSVLDAIWLALGGGRAAKETSRPIRDGEETAYVYVDLGKLMITRTWDSKGTTLKVQDADGKQQTSPQMLLNALLGELAFDPLAFTLLGPREQRDALLGLVELDVDLDELAAERAALYEQRTEIGQQSKALGEPVVRPDLPDEIQSYREIGEELRAAQDRNREIVNAQQQRHSLDARIRELTAELHRLNAAAADAEELAERAPTPTAEIAQRLEQVEETNADIRDNNDAKERKAKKEQYSAQRDQLTRDIEAIDKRKAQALRAARFPVDGLGFGNGVVTYSGVPFSQASSAEQIRVSAGMGMAMNPDLRVMFIRDGSLLDQDSMAALREQVAEQDFQLWIERVGDADAAAVIIEDGEIAP